MKITVYQVTEAKSLINFVKIKLMKSKICLFIILIFSIHYFNAQEKSIAEKLVQEQVEGYNARNIEAFVKPYAEDVELYMFPDKLISKGKEAMRKDYSEMFKKLPELHCEIKNRIVNGNFIIDQESISGMRKGEKVVASAIYEIKDGKISKVYFIP